MLVVADALEAIEGLAVGRGGRIVPGSGDGLDVDNGVQNGVVGDDVEALVPLLLLLVALRPARASSMRPWSFAHSAESFHGQRVTPDVVAIPPVEQQVGIGAEAGRIARSEKDIVGLAAVDGSVGGRRGIGLDGRHRSRGRRGRS